MSLLDLLFFAANLHQIETTRFTGRPLDMLVFVIVGWAGLWIYCSLVWPIRFLGSGFASYVAYYYSRVLPDQLFQMIGVPLPIQSAWLPFLFLLMDSGRGIRQIQFTLYTDFVAHLYFIIGDVLPRRYGVGLFRLPSSWNGFAARYLQP
jgi:hypothetical protein